MKRHQLASACSALATLLSATTTSAASPDETLDAVELDPFTVVSTGTGTERLARDVPIRTELLRPELFTSTGARDLAAALEYLPGLRTESNCQNCGTTEIKMLGLGAGYNQLLFDGQPLFSGLAAVYGIEHIPTAFIGRIEVVKGGASSLYGPSAVAGIINILPREPVADAQRLETSLESIHGQPSFSATYLRDWSRDQGQKALTLYAQTHDSHAVDLDGDGFSEVTEKQFRTLGLHGWSYPTERGKLTANYSYSWEKRRGGDSPDLLPHQSQIAEQLEHDWHRGGLAWEGYGDSNFNYRLGASFSYVERDSYYGGVGPTHLPGQPAYHPSEYAAALAESRLLYGYSDTLRTYLDSFFSTRLGQHYLSWGAQYQIDEVFDEKRDDQDRPLRADASVAEFSGQDPIAHDQFTNLGIFLQDEWMPTDNVNLIAGLRLDRHSELSRSILSPRVALRYSPQPSWTWRASIATGFRAPEIFDEDLHIEILADPTRTRNAPELREERSTSYAAGFVWTPAGDASPLQIEGELFRTEIRDAFNVSGQIHYDAQGNAYKQRSNSGGSTVQGFELHAAYRLTSRWSAELGLAHVDARYDDAPEVLPGIFERRYLETPAWTGVAKLRYENDKLFDLFLGLVHTGPMIAARERDGTLNPSTTPFYVVDLTATKHLHLDLGPKRIHFDLTAGIKNLFDERQPDLTSGPDRDTTYLYGPRAPRSLHLRLATNW